MSLAGANALDSPGHVLAVAHIALATLKLEGVDGHAGGGVGLVACLLVIGRTAFVRSGVAGLGPATFFGRVIGKAEEFQELKQLPKPTMPTLLSTASSRLDA